MLDFSLSDFIQEKTEALPENSLVLISESAFHISDNRIMFTPESIRVKADNGDLYMIQNPSIPIRKVESDQTMEGVLESVIVKKPNNDYININDISRSISWWIVNHAHELKYPQEVVIEYRGIDNERRVVLYERTGKKKWDIVASFNPDTETIVKEESKRPEESSVKDVYVDIMRKMWG